MIRKIKTIQSIPVSRNYLNKNKFISFDCDASIEDDYDVKNKELTREFKTCSLTLENLPNQK